MTTKNSKPSLKVELNVFEKGELVESSEFTGSRTEVVDFINFNYVKNLLKTFFEGTIKFRINEIGEFETFENLVEKGVFII